MTLPYTPENLPDEYPIDQTLLIEAETTPGIDIHDRNTAAHAYKSRVSRYNRSEDAGGHLWFKCVDAERSLRGIIAEACISRRAIIKPLHQEG